MPDAGEVELRRLGARLRELRIAAGISQRSLVKAIGLSAHSNLADYELGRRLPPADILEACERALGVADAELRRLRDEVLAARAAAAVRPASPVPPMGRPPRHGRVPLRLVTGVMAVALAAGTAAIVYSHRSRHPEQLILAHGPRAARVSSCDDGAVILERDLVGPQMPAADGADPADPVGELALRYSPSCGLAWARSCRIWRPRAVPGRWC